MAKRGKLFVDKKVQGAIVKRIVLHWLGFIACCFFVVMTLQLLLGNPELTWLEHAQTVWTDYALFLLLMLVLLPSFVWDSVRMSHRFAGPVVRLRRFLNELGEGKEVGNLKFRDHDFWMDISDSFNRVNDRVKQLESELAEARGEKTASA